MQISSMRAAATPAATPVLSPTAAEVSKVTLADTSIDGPALWTSSSGVVRSILAWTGTDTAHHLNVMSSGIGSIYGNKVTLADASVARPAVARSLGGKVAIAWIGTDASHTLNVLYDAYGAWTKLTLWGENSAYSPALASLDESTLLLAWTGTNSGHSLNTLRINVGGSLTKGAKTTLWSYSSLSGPSLHFASARSEHILSWSAASPSNRVAFSVSTDTQTWSSPTTLVESSGATPSVVGIVDGYYGMPAHYLAWTGTDVAHGLNFQYTQGFPAWPDPSVTKATLAESAWGAPALGFIGGPSQMLVAWTGTDTAHHLNVATLTPMAPSPCQLPGISPITPQVIRQSASGRKEMALTFDEDEGIGNPTSLLDTLKAKGVPSTWFLTARWAQDHPDLAARAQREDHLIGDHTVDHPSLTSPTRTDNFICSQLTLANQIIVERAGVTSTRPYFRPPYGDYNDQVVTRAAGLGYKTVLWSIDPRDWDDATSADTIYNTVTRQLAPGKIILMHGGSLHEPEALPRVVDYIKSQGYALVTLDQLLAP
ncbi:MAG TPA: polysaccharide deacetylase family protein [Ktedonobacterales bacterium]